VSEARKAAVCWNPIVEGQYGFVTEPWCPRHSPVGTSINSLWLRLSGSRAKLVELLKDWVGVDVWQAWGQ
jgi:hypothetical protein